MAIIRDENPDLGKFNNIYIQYIDGGYDTMELYLPVLVYDFLEKMRTPPEFISFYYTRRDGTESLNYAEYKQNDKPKLGLIRSSLIKSLFPYSTEAQNEASN